MRLLLVFVKEAYPGTVLPAIAAEIGDAEAVRVHEALVTILLRQLQGLEKTRLRFVFRPDDADEALRFSLLPRMAERFENRGDSFLIPAAPGKPALEIDFRPQGNGSLGERLARAFDAGFAEGFSEVAVIGPDCPGAGARWIHAAFSMLGEKADVVLGPTPAGGCHLLAANRPVSGVFAGLGSRDQGDLDFFGRQAKRHDLKTAILPPLPVVRDRDDWLAAWNGPFGPALRRILRPDDEDPEIGVFD